MSGWQIATSSAAGAFITLIGVLVGSFLTGRSQHRQWARDKQVKACMEVITESTRVQRALWRRWAHGDEVEWMTWNESLAGMWLLGNSRLIEAATKIDENFYRHAQRIKGGDIANIDDWVEARDEMEGDRLAFINVARAQLLKANDVGVTKALGGRPPLPPSPSEAG